MRSKSLVWLAAVAMIVSAAIPVIAQERKKKAAPADFPSIADEAKTAFAEKRYGACVALLKSGIKLCSAGIRAQIVECMPAAPAGFEKLPPMDEASGAMADAMMASMGQTIQQDYQSKDGSKSLSITVMLDSPMAAGIATLAKIAGSDPGSEIVKYGTDSAIFKKQGDDSFEIQILVNDKHVITGNGNGLAEEPFFKVFDQAFVDRVRNVMAGN